MTSCPVCTGALPPGGGSSCEMCGVPLRYEGGTVLAVHPLIRPGDTLVSRDFARDPLPGEKQRGWSRLDGTTAIAERDGILVTTPNGAEAWLEDWSRARDTCVRTTIAAMDPWAKISVMARREPISGARTFFSLDVFPAERKARLARCFSTKDDAGVTALVDWTFHPAIAGVGAFDDLELRVQGTALEGWINGQRFCAHHDASLGIGFAGLRIERTTPQGKTSVRFRGFEVKATAA